MEFFLDSAHTDEIKHALEMWNIDGVTTNPKHVQASGKPFLTVVQEIGRLVEGTDKTVSVEVNPHHDDHREMVKEGIKLAGLCPNFVIKLPATEAGLRAIPDLAAKNAHMARLRQKLETDPARPNYLLSVYGEGYKFAGRLKTA